MGWLANLAQADQLKNGELAKRHWLMFSFNPKGTLIATTCACGLWLSPPGEDDMYLMRKHQEDLNMDWPFQWYSVRSI